MHMRDNVDNVKAYIYKQHKVDNVKACDTLRLSLAYINKRGTALQDTQLNHNHTYITQFHKLINC